MYKENLCHSCQADGFRSSLLEGMAHLQASEYPRGDGDDDAAPDNTCPALKPAPARNKIMAPTGSPAGKPG